MKHRWKYSRNNSVIVWSIDTSSHSFALSGLSNHCRTISGCSRYFAQFPRHFDSYSNYCLDCRVMGVLRLDRLVHTSRTSTREELHPEKLMKNWM